MLGATEGVRKSSSNVSHSSILFNGGGGVSGIGSNQFGRFKVFGNVPLQRGGVVERVRILRFTSEVR
jgi:hypothetical protein